ncbi:MAG: metallophosphoesterase [Planctomycetaceae bacterium]|nr:metallophosphoesterase [Planctomycetaceae bacterium]
MTGNEVQQISRRAFLKNGTLVLAATASLDSSLLLADKPVSKKTRVGIVTDLHYADKSAAGSRHYRESPEKLNVAALQFAQQKPDFIVELGDFIDAADSVQTEIAYLKRINKDFITICKQRHYVLGNHCVYTLKKQEFLDVVEQKKSYYSFDSGNFHFIVLDSCFRSDGQAYGRKNFEWTDPNIPTEELEWLQADLNATQKKTVIFAHQRLDVSNHYGVKNCLKVRSILEQSEKVLAVFQGHSHQNDHNEINGIHYCTMVAMVEGSGDANNAFSIMEIANNGTIKIEGFKKQADYLWKK